MLFANKKFGAMPQLGLTQLLTRKTPIFLNWRHFWKMWTLSENIYQGIIRTICIGKGQMQSLISNSGIFEKLRPSREFQKYQNEIGTFFPLDPPILLGALSQIFAFFFFDASPKVITTKKILRLKRSRRLICSFVFNLVIQPTLFSQLIFPNIEQIFLFEQILTTSG